MSVLDILRYPDHRLRKKSGRISKVDNKIRKLLDDMVETIHEAPGVGLAAPQVGHNIRAIVVDLSSEEEETFDLMHLINPEIIHYEGEQVGEEGCLSVPGFVANVKRKDAIEIKALDSEGKEINLEASGLLSRVLQHEIDHLDGILFFDRLSRLKKELFKKKIEKAFDKRNR